jgi:hypothetical protein
MITTAHPCKLQEIQYIKTYYITVLLLAHHFIFE